MEKATSVKGRQGSSIEVTTITIKNVVLGRLTTVMGSSTEAILRTTFVTAMENFLRRASSSTKATGLMIVS